MPETVPFSDFVRRIRAGDETAAQELVRHYEPLIRREVRLHLEDRRLQRLFDSMDICQSVLASFFPRMAEGQYDVNRPEDLVKLLVKMARNKLASAARRQYRQRRDQRRHALVPSLGLYQVADPNPSPGDLVAGIELMQRFQNLLSPEERQVADLRSQGLAWADIAERLGGKARARRMQLSRAAERVLRQLGWDANENE